jgi:uncharacterized protein (TIGR02145 family)
MKRLTLLLLVTALVISCSKNSPPVIENLIAEPDSVYPGDTVTFTFKVFDIDGDGIAYLFHKTAGTWIMNFDTGDPARWIAPKEPGDHYLTFSISDLTDKVADSVMVHVMDTAGVFTDARDGHTYKWIKIGKQIWMAENLAFLPRVNSKTELSYTEKLYYVFGYQGSDPSEAIQLSNYSDYGVLYNHMAIADTDSTGLPNSHGVCPAGWHMPRGPEWDELIARYGGQFNAGGSLKESGQSHWAGANAGATNRSGFSALPGGKVSDRGEYVLYGEACIFWESGSASRLGPAIALSTNNIWAMRGMFWSSNGHSVRCVKDNITDSLQYLTNLK